MQIKRKLSYIRLLVPVLLFAGVQAFAQAPAESRMPVVSSASPNTMRPHADTSLISDRNFLLKSIARIVMEQSMASQSAGTSCSSSVFSVAYVRTFPPRCPIIDCAVPPPGCSYQNPLFDQNGCQIGCGELVCGPEN